MLIRVTKMSGKFYGIKISSVNADAMNISTLADEGTPAIIVGDLEDLKDLGINPKDVEMVERS